jgi:hypothetical protein
MFSTRNRSSRRKGGWTAVEEKGDLVRRCYRQILLHVRHHVCSGNHFLVVPQPCDASTHCEKQPKSFPRCFAVMKFEALPRFSAFGTTSVSLLLVVRPWWPWVRLKHALPTSTLKYSSIMYLVKVSSGLFPSLGWHARPASSSSILLYGRYYRPHLLRFWTYVTRPRNGRHLQSTSFPIQHGLSQL